MTPVKKHPKVETILRRAYQYVRKHVRRGFYFEPDHGDTVCGPCLTRLERLGLVVERDPVKGQQAEWYYDDPDADHDVLPRCDASSFRVKVGCGRILNGWLTMYGARDNLSYLVQDGFNPRKGEDCYLWMLIENTLPTDCEEYVALLKLAGVQQQTTNVTK